MKNPFKKKPTSSTGIMLQANAADKRTVQELTNSVLKILNTSAGDSVKEVAVKAVTDALKSSISSVNINNVDIKMGVGGE